MSSDLPLGKAVPVPRAYAPQVLVGIPRSAGRADLGLTASPPFDGVDVWNAYELSWLDAHGRPRVALGELRARATSPRMVESKSLKLYLHSLNNERFDSSAAFRERVVRDVSEVVGDTIELRTFGPDARDPAPIRLAEGQSLDDQELAFESFHLDPAHLTCAPGDVPGDVPIVDETLHSHLLRSNCPVTGQPDWGTLVLRYRGKPIQREGLLRYVVSYRQHDGFHEHCVERIFVDVKQRCAPEALTVFARYTRRGGLDICPFRSDFETLGDCPRLVRQ